MAELFGDLRVSGVHSPVAHRDQRGEERLAALAVFVDEAIGRTGVNAGDITGA
ncbi:hypothetical protein [Streptomyces sp. NBC_00690]|uniref:hypothetical protein n=1 Tax=Streptomyces sp. NBC_00690 TaxID=2975808 RepID=UPI002E285FE7|nr:hypothetical protein [Streptomyces sp. NBC_00690]